MMALVGFAALMLALGGCTEPSPPAWSAAFSPTS